MTTYSDAIDIITEETEKWFNSRAWFQLEKDEDADEAINREMPRLTTIADDEDYYDATADEIRQNVNDGLNAWCDGAINEAIEAALECESDAAADWFRDGCTEGPKMYREEGGEMAQVVRRVLAAIESERVAKEYADSPDNAELSA
jgi:hypothetical protein